VNVKLLVILCHFGEKYEGTRGTLDSEYYGIKRSSCSKLKNIFKDAPKEMKAFEHWVLDLTPFLRGIVFKLVDSYLSG